MRIFLKLMIFAVLSMSITACSKEKSEILDTGAQSDAMQDSVDNQENNKDVKQDTTPTEDVHVVQDVKQDTRADDMAGHDIPPDSCINDYGQEEVTQVTDVPPTDPGTPEDIVTDVPPIQKSGECKGPQDCNNHACVNLEKIDFHVCLQQTPTELTGCTGSQKSDLDECCNSADCKDKGSGCYYINPINFYGGMPIQEHNICIADECTTDKDCDKKDSKGNPVPGLCLPAGVNGWPRTRCIVDYCARFNGCDKGSYCRAMIAPCGDGAYMDSFCASSDTCETNQDCKDGKRCTGDVKTGKTQCKKVFCPL